MPADPMVNGNKSDKLPTSKLLLSRQQVIQEHWEHLRSELTEPFDLQARHLFGKPLPKGNGWKSDLFSRLREAVEVTANQRGVTRWAPVDTVTRVA